MFSDLRKIDKNIYNENAPDFIPIACHYNENTLLTKDGKLVQIVKINGINSEKISDKLYNLREIIRASIKKNISTYDFAFWVHTIREKQNLDDPALDESNLYKKLLSDNIHTLWQRKNHWNDKFVNTLYISIVYDSTKVKITNFNTLINSLSSKLITDFENKYLDNALKKLDEAVSNILIDLQELGAEKLGIIFEGDKSISLCMALYNRIANLSNDDCLVPLVDLSSALGRNRYTISGDKIVVIDDEEDKKFVSILSIKEYQETTTAALDKFLQLPIELIVTEIFHFVDKKLVVSALKNQDYILKVSGDSHLINYKGINKLAVNSSLPQFCNQQISITIIATNPETLDHLVTKASSELFKLGIVHFREDLDIEQTFWAQLPGNFAFIRRMKPLSIDNIAAFATLHNAPLGDLYNPWGRALTLLRTEKGTPYFMNFHDRTGKGHTCIFGTERTGKTVLLNFLLSEATKYEPTIVYIASNNDPKIFIEALEGKWLEPEKEFINPFLLDNTKESEAFIFEFLKLITNHYNFPLTEDEISFVQNLKSKILSTEKEKQIFSEILKSEDFTTPAGESMFNRLKNFMDGGLYSGLFDASALSLTEGKIVGLNLYKLSEEHFTKQFYPNERKFLEQFNRNLKAHQAVCAGLMYALSHHLTLTGTKPKIFVTDNLNKLYKPEFYYENINLIYNNLSQNNAIMVSTFDFTYLKSSPNHIIQKWLDLINTKITLPSDVKIKDLDGILGLNKADIYKLSQLLLSSRAFLINKDNKSIISELSIAALIGIVRILSAKEQELNIYKEILEQHQGPPDNWLVHLYNALNMEGKHNIDARDAKEKDAEVQRKD